MNQFFSCLFAEILFQNQGVPWRLWPLKYRGQYYRFRENFWMFYFDFTGQLASSYEWKTE